MNKSKIESPYLENILNTHTLSTYPVECFCRDDFSVGESSGLHWHTYCEMVYVNYGVYTMIANNEEIDLKQGDLLYIGAGQMHCTSCKSDTKTKLTVLKFDTSILTSGINSKVELGYLSPFLSRTIMDKTLFAGDLLKDTKILSMLNSILLEIKERKFAYEYSIHNYVCSIILLIMRVMHESNSDIFINTSNALMHDSFSKVIHYIDENLSNEISPATAAALCNLSYSNFAIKFKRLTGKTFIEYVNVKRISLATKMLKTTSSTISEIALDCGFNNISYFLRIFKSIIGMSPLVYRKIS